jgi:hypothetical protein
VAVAKSFGDGMNWPTTAGRPAQAPAEARLAAAISTINFSRRPMRPGAVRSKEFNFRMTHFP